MNYTFCQCQYRITIKFQVFEKNNQPSVEGGCQAELAVFITGFIFQNALIHGIVGVGHQADQSGFVGESMELVKISTKDADRIAHLVSAFRIPYKGIKSQPNVEAGKEEILEFLKSGFPVYAVEDNGAFVGYIVCRIDEPCLWVEHIFVQEDCRRKGIATILFNKAEEIAASMGEDTVYNFVHPNNEGMIRFLRSKGYTVLNMIEIRKPYKGEKPATTIHVEKETFDY